MFILIILPVLILVTNRLTFNLWKLRGLEVARPEDVETAVINKKIEETLSSNMAKEFD